MVVKTRPSSINALLATNSQSFLHKSSTAKTDNKVACTSSTLPKSGAAGTKNVLPGPSSGNSYGSDNTNDNKKDALVEGVVAHIEKGKKDGAYVNYLLPKLVWCKFF
jgi:hypothetical protein